MALRSEELTAKDAVWLLRTLRVSIREIEKLERRLSKIEGQHHRDMNQFNRRVKMAHDRYERNLAVMHRDSEEVKSIYDSHRKRFEEEIAGYERSLSEVNELNRQLLIELHHARDWSPFDMQAAKKRSAPS